MCCDIGAIGDHHLWSVGGIRGCSVVDFHLLGQDCGGASINNSSQRGWGLTLLWCKETIVSTFYVHTCRPGLSGVASVGFSFHVATHCIPVVVQAYLSASFRVVFWAN